MANELDMEAYHSDDQAVDPGGHKVFTIENQIHSFGARFQGSSDFGKEPRDTFNQRFEGEPGTLPTQGPSFDSTKMPPWWVRVLGPNTKWPGEGPQPPPLGPGVLPYPEMEILPYDSNRPQGGPKLVADVEPSIESLAQKHQAEGSSIIEKGMDILKHPMDYISPMPGELGMAKGMFPGGRYKIPISKESLEDALKQGLTHQEIAEKAGVDRKTIQQRLKEYDLSKTRVPKVRLTPRVGEEAEIEARNKAQIEERNAPGESLGQTKERYGASGKASPSYESPDIEYEEAVRRYMKANPEEVSKWMRNQFEGAPVETEPKYNLKQNYKASDIEQYNPFARDSYTIKDSEGRIVSNVDARYYPDQKRITLDLHSPGTHEEMSNTVGTVNMKSMVKELLKYYPEAKWLSGYRTTGSRAASGGKLTLIPIPKSWRD